MYRFNNTVHTHDFDLQDLKPILRKQDPDLRVIPELQMAGDQINLNRHLSAGPVFNSCMVLKKMSLTALSAAASSLVRPSSNSLSLLNLQTGPAIVDRVCNHCHQQPRGDFAPELDFNDPVVMKATVDDVCDRINRPLTDDNHMPKLWRLEPSQKKALLDYFGSKIGAVSCSPEK
jgi:hypothetical protein